jgi:hypothetical protein
LLVRARTSSSAPTPDAWLRRRPRTSINPL